MLSTHVMEVCLEPVFSTEEVRRLERAHPEGLPAGAIVELLRQRGVELAEATFRKYVQLGLLPRSKRVGRKGKHRGSHGLYPAGVVGRIAEIRQLMDSGLTLEEIQRSAVAYTLEIESLQRSTEVIVARLEEALAARPASKASTMTKVRAIRMQAATLVEALTEATREILPAESAPVAVHDNAQIAREAAKTLGPRRAARTAAPNNVSRKPSNARSGLNR